MSAAEELPAAMFDGVRGDRGKTGSGGGCIGGGGSGVRSSGGDGAVDAAARIEGERSQGSFLGCEKATSCGACCVVKGSFCAMREGSDTARFSDG